MAKEPNPEEQSEQLENIEKKDTKRSLGLSILLPLIGLVSLVLFQVMALYFILPSPADVADEIKNRGINTQDPGPYIVEPGVIPSPDVSKIEMVERPLGDPFRVQEPDPETPGQTNVFTVTVILKVDKKEATKFDLLLTERTHTLRGIVYAVLRSSTKQERTSETLGKIRSKIRVKINEELGSNFVKDVVCDNPSNVSM